MRAKPKSINEDELLAALQEASLPAAGDSKGLSAQELAAKAGVSNKLILKRLWALQKDGRLGVGRKRFTRIDGVESMVPCYWVKK